MHLTKAQAEALAAGMPLAEVLAMATQPQDPAPTLEGMQAAVTAAQAENGTLTAANATLTTQVTTLTAEKVAAEAAVTSANAERDTARSEAETLKSIVADAVTKLSTAVGTTVDASKLSATELVAKHGELQLAAREKFKNVPTYDDRKPGMKNQTQKSEAEQAREAAATKALLASAKSISIL